MLVLIPICFFPLLSGMSGQDIGVECVPMYHSIIIISLFTVSPHVCRVCEPLAVSSTNEVIRNKCSKVQQLGPATPQRSLPTILRRILRPPFPPLEPDCYPTRTSPQIEMVQLTGNVGTLCFQSPRECWLALEGDIFTVCGVLLDWQETEVQEMRHGQRVKEGKDPS